MHEIWALSHCPVGNKSGQFRPWLTVQSFISRERTGLMVFSSNMGQIFFFLILRTVRHTFDRAVMSPDSHVNLLLTNTANFEGELTRYMKPCSIAEKHVSTVGYVKVMTT
jgi:hypothetical protein